MADTTHDNAGVIAPPPLIYAAGLIAGFGLHKVLPVRLLPGTWAGLIGWPLILCSFIPGGWAAATMLRAKTNLDPFHSTTAIVISGPFKYTRNPIYVSFGMLYLGISALVNSLTMLLPLPLVLMIMQRGVIEREEQYLERKFGAEYTEYKARVRRWL